MKVKFEIPMTEHGENVEPLWIEASFSPSGINRPSQVQLTVLNKVFSVPVTQLLEAVEVAESVARGKRL